MSAGFEIIPDSGLLPPMLAMDFNTIVFLVVIVVSLLSRVFGKKDPEHGEDWIEGEEWDQEPAVRQNDSGPRESWEEQMRRLLEGKTLDQTKPPPLVSATAPVVVPSPPPLKVSPDRPAAPLLVPSDAYSLSNAESESDAYSLSNAESESDAYSLSNAESESESVGSGVATVKHHHRSIAASNAIELLSNPQSSRQAIITAVILAPAKGLS